MPTVRQMLRSLITAKHEVARLEDLFFTEMGRLASTVPNGAKGVAKGPSRRVLRRTLKCPKCSRRFARPVHLGRHLSATHKRRRKKAA